MECVKEDRTNAWNRVTKFICESLITATWLEFVCPANQHPKRTIKKKSPCTFAHLVNFSKNLSAMFDNHAIFLFDRVAAACDKPVLFSVAPDSSDHTSHEDKFLHVLRTPTRHILVQMTSRPWRNGRCTAEARLVNLIPMWVELWNAKEQRLSKTSVHPSNIISARHCQWFASQGPVEIHCE